MEGWQKQLNEVLRLGNGFANCGAIPKLIRRAGEEAIQKYLDARAQSKPSDARWVYEKAMLQSHSHFAMALEARVQMQERGDEFEWSEFCQFWKRYSAMAHAMIRMVSRCRLRRARATQPAPHYYARLLLSHHTYWAASDLTMLSAADLNDSEKRLQR